MSRRDFAPRGPRPNTKRISQRQRAKIAKLRQQLWAKQIAEAGHQPGQVVGQIEGQDTIAPSVEIDYSRLPSAFVAPGSNIRKDGGDDTENR